MKFINKLFSEMYRFLLYFALSVLFSIWCGARLFNIRSLESGVEIKLVDSNFAFWYLFIAVILLVIALFISYINFNENSWPENLRKQFVYSFHWVGIILLNLQGITFYSHDVVRMSNWMFVTFFLTSTINSLPWFKDTLDSKYEIHESWKFEDFIFFRGHFSKNRPKAARNPLHAAWPVILCCVFSISIYGFISKEEKPAALANFIGEIGRRPASIGNSETLSKENENFQMLKGIFLLSLTAAGLFVVYNHSLRSDYAKKWELLNKHHHTLLELYADRSNNRAQIQICEIQFAIDLIETNMWGHRSFNPLFTRIIERFDGNWFMINKKKVPRKELIRALSDELFMLTHRTAKGVADVS